MGSVLVLTSFGILSVTAAEDPGCPAFEGSTIGTAALNEGIMDFDSDLAAAPLDAPGMTEANKTCIRTQTDYNEKRVFFEGWVWNDNLGLVSMKGGNNTVEIGSGDYFTTGPEVYNSYLYLPNGIDGPVVVPGSETTVDTGVGLLPTAPQLFGYWWGENLGFLRLNCREYYDSQVEADDPSTTGVDESKFNYCGSSNHRVYVQSLSGDNAVLSGHAWSDAHGWVDFSGVEVPVDELYQSIYPKVTLQAMEVKNPRDGWKPTSSNVVANAFGKAKGQKFETGYAVSVEFYGAPDFSGGRLDVPGANFCFEWNDDRYADYNDLDPLDPEVGTPVDIVGCYGSEHSRAEKMPYGVLDKEFNQDDFNFKSKVFVTKPESILRSHVPASTGELVLEAILVNGQRFPLGPDYALTFAPPYEYKLFQGELEGDCEDYELSAEDRNLSLFLGYNEPVTLCGDFNEGGLQIGDSLRVDTNYTLEAGDGWDLTDLFFDPDLDNFIVCASEDEVANHEPLDEVIRPGSPAPKSIVESAIIWLGVLNREACEEGGSASLDAVDIDSVLTTSKFDAIVSYQTAKGIRVVREAANLEKGQVTVSQANIEGNVQASAVQLFDDDVNYSSSGGSLRAETREAVLKDFSEILKGSSGGCKVNTANSFEGDIEDCRVDDGLYLIDFTSELGLGRGAGSGDKESVRMSEIGWGVEEVADGFAGKTLVVIGSSIIVDNNLYFEDGDRNYQDKAAYGLVALKDYTRRGGHVYITSGVTDIRGHIYTDGSVFAVELAELVGTRGGSINGVLTRVRENSENLFNQLTIVGQVVSNNTVGGGTSSTPIAANGALLNEFDRELAKAADINFWRNSPMGLNRVGELAGDAVISLCGQEEVNEGLITWLGLAEGDPRYSRGSAGEPTTVTVGLINEIITFADDAVELSDFFCWQSDRGLTSQYFDTERGAADEQPPYERFVLNILFEVAPKGLPLF